MIMVGKTIREKFIGTGMGKSSELRVNFIEKTRIILIGYVNDVKMTGKKQKVDPMWKKLIKHVDLDDPTSFLDHVYFGMYTT